MRRDKHDHLLARLRDPQAPVGWRIKSMERLTRGVSSLRGTVANIKAGQDRHFDDRRKREFADMQHSLRLMEERMAALFQNPSLRPAELRPFWVLDVAAVVQNPAYPLWLLEMPNLWQYWGTGTWYRIHTYYRNCYAHALERVPMEPRFAWLSSLLISLSQTTEKNKK